LDCEALGCELPACESLAGAFWPLLGSPFWATSAPGASVTLEDGASTLGL
jgi:hypothetical protein